MGKNTIDKSGSFKLYSNLVNADSSVLYHEKHQNILPHPADILTEKLQKLTKAHKKILELSDTDIPHFVESLDHVAQLIFSVDEFYDSLPLIIKCFTPPNGADNKDVPRWLKHQKSKPYSRLLDGVSFFHNDFKNIANKLKHDHAEIAKTTLTNHHNIKVHGFYIRVATGENDQRGPAPEIHKKYKGTVNTAFSYNHFMLRSIGHIFNCIDNLNKALFSNQKTVKDHSESSLFSLLVTGSSVTHEFFPDEYSRPYANIKENHDKLEIEFPFRYRKKTNEHFDRIRSVNSPISVNGRTNSSHALLPYLQLIYPETLTSRRPDRHIKSVAESNI